MAKRVRRKSVSPQANATGPIAGGSAGEPGSSGTAPSGTTGRVLVAFKDGVATRGVDGLCKALGLSIASTADAKDGGGHVESLGESQGLMFPDLGIAVVKTVPSEIHAFAATENSHILAIEPERIVYAIEDAPEASAPRTSVLRSSGIAVSPDYLRGYREAVNELCDKLLGPAADLVAEGLAPLLSEIEVTWGLQATKVPASHFTGKGIRVAVLDTGLDLGHPDFAGRRVTSKSFVRGQAVQDGHGHGTHCIGTSCGPRRPETLPRYGIAYGAEIFAGKVLSNQGSGGDADILAGMQWAITNRCAVVSMSLGAPVQVGQTFSQVFEQAAMRALAAGTLIIAAGGNESQRPQDIQPVGHPANCPSIMAVGAVDRNCQIAPFSSGGLIPQGGQVDIAAPGVDITSSWPRPKLYNTISGTSMATPHVAGIAALWAESNPAYRGRALMSILTQSARRLSLPGRDVGAGLVHAP